MQQKIYNNSDRMMKGEKYIMMDVDTFVLENGVEYIEVDKLVYENVTYVLLSNIKNVKDSCIKKLVIKDNKKYLYELDSNVEFDKILKLFVEKNKALFN